MSEPFRGRGQPRHPRLDAGLGAVRAAEGAAGNAERACTWCWTTSASVRSSCYGGLIDTPNIDRIAGVGAAVHAVAHDGAVLAHPLVPADRPQPHHQRHGLHHRGGDRLPERQRARPAGVRHPGRDARRARASARRWSASGTCAPQDEMNLAAAEAELAAGPGLRALLRLPGRRDQPVVSRPGPRQPPGRRSPARPAEGYHLSVDLTDKAIEFIDDVKTIAPDRPVFLYYALGAAHAPHHVPREWADRYKGRFDMGYEAAREQILARQKQMGIVPAEHRAAADQPDRDAGDPHRVRTASRSRRWTTPSPGTGLSG